MPVPLLVDGCLSATHMHGAKAEQYLHELDTFFGIRLHYGPLGNGFVSLSAAPVHPRAPGAHGAGAVAC